MAKRVPTESQQQVHSFVIRRKRISFARRNSMRKLQFSFHFRLTNWKCARKIRFCVEHASRPRSCEWAKRVYFTSNDSEVSETTRWITMSTMRMDLMAAAMTTAATATSDKINNWDNWNCYVKYIYCQFNSYCNGDERRHWITVVIDRWSHRSPRHAHAQRHTCCFSDCVIDWWARDDRNVAQSDERRGSLFFIDDIICS